MDSLSDEVLLQVLASPQAGLSVQEALHFGRASSRFHHLVSASDALWLKLSTDICSETALSAKRPSQTWREFFQAQYRQQRMRARQKHRVKVLNAQSHLETVQKDLDKQRRLLKHEQARLQRLNTQLSEAKRAMLAQGASQVWEPVAVRRFHSDVVEQSSIPSEIRLQQGEVQLVALQIKQHINGVRANKQKLKEANRKLKELRP